MSEELSWRASQDERLIALVARDVTDSDYLWAILARDAIGCFRWVLGEVSVPSQPRAEEGLILAMAGTVKNKDIEELGRQADDTNWRRAPAYSTIRFILQQLDPASVEQVFRRHAAVLHAQAGDEWQRHVAIDGKALRRSLIISRTASRTYFERVRVGCSVGAGASRL
jgi:hypothetical protein